MTNRRKALIEAYKQMKPDMGIFCIRARGSNQLFLETAHDLKSFINRTLFQLNMGSHPNKMLQQDWTKLGEEHFDIEVLEKLTYDKDETKEDYSEELAILRMMWEERLTAEGAVFYQKRLP